MTEKNRFAFSRLLKEREVLLSSIILALGLFFQFLEGDVLVSDAFAELWSRARLHLGEALTQLGELLSHLT